MFVYVCVVCVCVSVCPCVGACVSVCMCVFVRALVCAYRPLHMCILYTYVMSVVFSLVFEYLHLCASNIFIQLTPLYLDLYGLTINRLANNM